MNTNLQIIELEDIDSSDNTSKQRMKKEKLGGNQNQNNVTKKVIYSKIRFSLIKGFLMNIVQSFRVCYSSNSFFIFIILFHLAFTLSNSY
jgi:hypothetical protein